MKELPLYYVRPITNLKDMLESSADIYQDKPAFLVKETEGGKYSQISFRKFKNDVDALGTALIELGLKDKRIALIGETRYEWALSYLSVTNGVGIIVPLDKELPQSEIENLLQRSGASAIIFSGKFSEQMNNIAGNLLSPSLLISMDASEDRNNRLSLKKIISRGYELIGKGNRQFIDAKLDNDSMSVLLFTSGTTASSKAVMLSHHNLASNLMAMSSMLLINDTDIFLSILPIHHTYECTCGLFCPLYRGATVAVCEGLRHIPKNLQESKATVMLGVPLIFETMYKRVWDQASKKPGLEKKLRFALKLSSLLKHLGIDLSRKLFAQIHESFGGHVRLFISGAAGIDPSIAKGFRDFGIPFVQGYGLTECSPIVALNRDVEYKNDAAGIPLPNLEIRIIDANEEGVGEIAVKGPSVMLGYYKDEENTAKVLKDGWFFTGDLGFIDKDRFLHITGRKKNVIITKNGKNVYPEEIESLLNKSIYILESMVYGKKDDNSGDILLSAIIVPNMDKIRELNGESANSELAYDLIKKEIRMVNSMLVNYKHIKDFNIRDEEFSKTTTKKIKRYVESNKLHK